MIRLYPLPFSLETESPNSTSSTEEASQLFSIASPYPCRSPPPDRTRLGRTSPFAATYRPGAPLLHLAVATTNRPGGRRTSAPPRRSPAAILFSYRPIGIPPSSDTFVFCQAFPALGDPYLVPDDQIGCAILLALL
jgi:hypothetical protein